jgi:hypothetical protein
MATGHHAAVSCELEKKAESARWKRTRRLGGRALSGSGRGELSSQGKRICTRAPSFLGVGRELDEGVGKGARRAIPAKVSGEGRGTSSMVDGDVEAEAATATGEDSDLHGGERESYVVPRHRKGTRRDLLHHVSGGDRRSAITGGSSTRSPLSRRGRRDGVRGEGGGEGRDGHGDGVRGEGGDGRGASSVVVEVRGGMAYGVRGIRR